MTWDKRLFDLFFVILLIVILGPILLALLVWLLLKEGRPVFYVAERMKGVDQPFMLWKLRTMTVVDEDTDEEKTWQIVGEHEASIEKGLLNVKSSIARALIGKEEGDSVEVRTPGGEKSYEILSVSYK